ncbi:ATP-dependent DNA helicase Q4 [Nowakowskiella sp. JEL0078]|nr:ATP-dependent DNA helicase Q4 [Nowakowskiella sp. JEL0078]
MALLDLAFVQVVIASSAYGMGMDKQDVQAVFHVGFPKTFSMYWQQVGRSGHDGLPANCVALVPQTAATIRKN